VSILEGKVAIVTGAGRALGRPHAIAPRAVTRTTETRFAAFGDEAVREPEPDSVSALVTFPASERAVHIDGQAFVIYGDLIQPLRGWQPVASIENSGAWRLDDVRTRISGSFRPAPSKLPPLG
jgi:hypothetical protein